MTEIEYTGLADMMTGKQMHHITRIACDRGLNVDAELERCFHERGVLVSRLNKNAAGRFIEFLSEQLPKSETEEILARYSVTDLVEQTDADLEHADELFYKSTTTLKVIAGGETNLIRWWRIDSDGTTYEARRFKNFVWCSCPGFRYSRKMCKHLALTAGVYCERCRVSTAKKGKLCYDCDGVVNRFRKTK